MIQGISFSIYCFCSECDVNFIQVYYPGIMLKCPTCNDFVFLEDDLESVLADAQYELEIAFDGVQK